MTPSVYCDHCGLPVPGRLAEDIGDPTSKIAEPKYCCFGCRFAADMALDKTGERDGTGAFFRLALCIFLSLNVMVFTMLLWTQDVYDPEKTGVPSAVSLWAVSRYLCMLFSLPVLYLLGLPVAEEAWKSLRRGAPSTDLLLIVGTVAAFAYSIVSTVRSEGPVYYEVGCAVLVLVTIGRWLEARGKQEATTALDSLEKLLPAIVHRREAGELIDVPLDTVSIGDRLFVRAGERIPTDGRIVSGLASIDTQLLTGESRPQVVETGDPVIGGTLNLDGGLTIEATAEPRGGTLERLLECIRTARMHKGRYQRLADRIAAAFLPVVVVVAIGTFAYHTVYSGLDQGLLAALAVVLIACPCALGLATPMAVWAAMGTAAQAQVLFRHGEALERLAETRVLAFDKTGTLTDGCPTVDRFVIREGTDGDELLARIASAVATSNHEFSQAVRRYCLAHGSKTGAACETQTLPGRGLVASFRNVDDMLYLGSLRMMQEHGFAPSPSIHEAIRVMSDEGLSLVCVARHLTVCGVFGLREELRSNAREAIAESRMLGCLITVLSGDHAERGRALSRLLDVDVKAELLPADKLDAVHELRLAFGPTVMIGDGINDAPALSAADVGIALGCGADVSRQSADICLLGNDLSRIPWAIRLSRQTVRIVRQNLFWSFFYNAFGVGLAATGWLNPVWAAAAMAISGLTVVANSLRLAPQATGVTTGSLGSIIRSPQERIAV
ncbi:MAG: heavy metal translocating P-type ATPase [Planctomycetia bacterium]|nr:heavy metal translocating P-type ATPase [Planctomycetia bacterium]